MTAPYVVETTIAQTVYDVTATSGDAYTVDTTVATTSYTVEVDNTPGGTGASGVNTPPTGTPDGDVPTSVSGAVVWVALTAADVGADTPAARSTALAALVDSAPTNLNTLNKLATAVGDDPGFATTVGSSLALKYSPTNPPPKTFPYSVTGTLTVTTGTARVYNDTGATMTISAVRASVGTAPTGAAVIVDVLKNGTTIFTTSGHRPSIAASANTATATAIDVTSWAAGSYLTVSVAQVGSTVAGADLTVQVTAS